MQHWARGVKGARRAMAEAIASAMRDSGHRMPGALGTRPFWRCSGRMAKAMAFANQTRSTSCGLPYIPICASPQAFSAISTGSMLRPSGDSA